MKGNLTEISNKYLSATLQVLEGAGVNVEDFDNLRLYPGFLERAARTLTELRQLLRVATGSNVERAKQALREIITRGLGEEKIFIQICEKACYPVVSIEAMRQLSIQEQYHVARLHPNAEVVRATAQELNRSELYSLLNNEVWHGWRFEIFEAAHVARFGGPSGVTRSPVPANLRK